MFRERDLSHSSTMLETLLQDWKHDPPSLMLYLVNGYGIQAGHQLREAVSTNALLQYLLPRMVLECATSFELLAARCWLQLSRSCLFMYGSLGLAGLHWFVAISFLGPG